MGYIQINRVFASRRRESRIIASYGSATLTRQLMMESSTSPEKLILPKGTIVNYALHEKGNQDATILIIVYNDMGDMFHAKFAVYTGFESAVKMYQLDNIIFDAADYPEVNLMDFCYA